MKSDFKKLQDSNNDLLIKVSELEHKLEEANSSKDFLTVVKQQTFEYENEIRVLSQRLKYVEEEVCTNRY